MFNSKMFAQTTTQANASASIVAAMTLTKTTDLNFGSIIPSTGGTIQVAPNGTRTVTSGAASLFGGTVTAATFTVGGTGNSTYAITLPGSHTISSGGNNMTVATFTSNPSGTGTLAAGTQTLTVGATLTVGNAQPTGVYTSVTGFDVTVNYN